MLQGMEPHPNNEKQQATYPPFAPSEQNSWRVSELHPLSGQKVEPSRNALSFKFFILRFVLAIVSVIAILFMSFTVISNFNYAMDPHVMQYQLIGLGIALIAITIINIAFNLRR